MNRGEAVSDRDWELNCLVDWGCWRCLPFLHTSVFRNLLLLYHSLIAALPLYSKFLLSVTHPDFYCQTCTWGAKLHLIKRHPGIQAIANWKSPRLLPLSSEFLFQLQRHYERTWCLRSSKSKYDSSVGASVIAPSEMIRWLFSVSIPLPFIYFYFLETWVPNKYILSSFLG
jgi:hypothetical protein